MKVKRVISDISVSVIIPLFNQKKYVADAIESSLSQKYKNLEVIVVNDGSTDNPEEILSGFNGSIKIINQSNRGLSAARNTGVKNSSGDYIQFLDADDILLPDKIEKQLKFNIENEAEISYCEISVTDNSKSNFRPLNIGKIKDIFKNYYLFWEPYPTPIHSLLIKRDIFNKFGLFDESIKANEDRMYFCYLAARGVRFEYLDICGGYYRLHGNSMNKDMKLMISSAIEFYKKINPVLGDELITNRIGLNGTEAIGANMTYLYLIRIRNGCKIGELRAIRNIIKKAGIEWNAEPLPSFFKKNKFYKMKIAAYFNRYLKKIFFWKKGRLEL